MVPSVEKKKNISEKEKKRKELYLKICEDWGKQMTLAIKNEIENGLLDQDVKYSAVKSMFCFLFQFSTLKPVMDEVDEVSYIKFEIAYWVR